MVEVKGSGDELVRNGKVAGQRLTVTAGKARGQVISVSSGTYVRVGGTKMWARSDSKSISPSERALFAFDLVLLTFYSPSYVPALQSGASDVRARLPITAHGVRVTPYAFAVDPANVAVAAKSLQTYSPPAGQVETTVDVDGHGRVIDFEQHETAGGKAFELQVTYSAINGPVVVKAPPANAVVS